MYEDGKFIQKCDNLAVKNVKICIHIRGVIATITKCGRRL